MGRRQTQTQGVLIAVAITLAASGCRERLLSSSSLARDPGLACADPSGDWIVVSPTQVFGPRVVVLQVTPESLLSLPEVPGPSVVGAVGARLVGAQYVPGVVLHITELPSRAADGSWGLSLVAGAMTGTFSCGGMDFTGQVSASGTPVTFHLGISADTVRGTVKATDASDTLYGLRVDSAQLVTPESLAGDLPTADSTPVLMLRVDDVWAQDTSFLPRLVARGLRAELAVPTTFPGEPQRNTWPNVMAAANQGFGLAAHSRIHSEVTGPGFDFMVEVLGSMQDLRARGFPTKVFVQPGQWADSLYFTSEQMLANWRGALLRNVAFVFEAYVGGWSVPTGTVGHVTFGVTHTTISGYDSSSILYQFRHLFVPGSYTIFMFHSKDVNPPDQLDWLLDSIAAAVTSGRLRMVNIATDLGYSVSAVSSLPTARHASAEQPPRQAQPRSRDE